LEKNLQKEIIPYSPLSSSVGKKGHGGAYYRDETLANTMSLDSHWAHDVILSAASVGIIVTK